MGKEDRLCWRGWSPDARTSRAMGMGWAGPPLPLLTLPSATLQPRAGKALEQATMGTTGPGGHPQPPRRVMERETPFRATPSPTAAPAPWGAASPFPSLPHARDPMGTANLSLQLPAPFQPLAARLGTAGGQ